MYALPQVCEFQDVCCQCGRLVTNANLHIEKQIQRFVKQRFELLTTSAFLTVIVQKVEGQNVEPRKNNKREEKRKKFFAKPEGKLVHHFWNDGRMMMCTEHLKLENWLDRRRRSDVWTNVLCLPP